MDVGVYSYSHGDPLLIDRIVNEFLSQGKFDKLRKECLSDADTKPAYQNLQQRVESTVAQFLKKQVWRPDLNKNQLRDSLRKHILDSNFFDAGINRIVDQVVNPNVLATVFLPEVEEVVYNYLSIPRPPDKSQKRGLSMSSYEKLKPPGSENDNKFTQEHEKNNQNAKSNQDDPMDGQLASEEGDTNAQRDSVDKNLLKENNSEVALESIKAESPGEEKWKPLQPIKEEEKIKSEEEESKAEEAASLKTEASFKKVDLPSDDSQESLSRMGVERLKIVETEQPQSIDSDDSAPLEINEKSMTESADSEDSIMNQMSPISQGRLTPDLPEEEKSEREERLEKEEKRPLTFIGRIPKIKREESDSSKSFKREETAGKSEKLDVKNVYSSDESDSGKSCDDGKSDSDERKSSRVKKRGERKSGKDERSRREDPEKTRREDDGRKSSGDKEKEKRSRNGKSKDSVSRDERGREKNGEIKKSSSSSCSSSSREKSSSSRRRSSHKSRHKESRSKDDSGGKKRKEEEKKKSKSADDHGKERNRKDDRRSTDRDSKERDRSGGSRIQGESRRREREQKTEESRGEKTRKDEQGGGGEDEVELMPEPEEMVIEMEEEEEEEEEDWMPEGEEIVLVDEDWICSDGVIRETTDVRPVLEEMELLEIRKDSPLNEEESVLDFEELRRMGALTKMDFPRVTDDFYVKFNSTGFKYFEEWEQKKLDCEEEFKEFVDEAENDLDLISDEETDPEGEFDFEGENRKTISNLLRGLGNFKRGLIFDPDSSEFYRWTNNKFYRRCERRWWRNAERIESDESTKENIESLEIVNRGENLESSQRGEKNKENLAREKKALHLKLLNRYKRRALRQGKQRRRNRRKVLREGIKEKNENPNSLIPGLNDSKGYRSEGKRFRIPEVKRREKEKEAETETEAIRLDPTGKARLGIAGFREEEKSLRKFNLDSVDGVPPEAEESIPGKPETETCEKAAKEIVSGLYELSPIGSLGRSDGGLRGITGNGLELMVVPSNLIAMLPDSPEEIKISSVQKKKRGSRGNVGNQKGNDFHQKCQLPPSPESDDSNSNVCSEIPVGKCGRGKRILKLDGSESIPRKQQKRNYCQKYDSQDLYKPRPILNSNRTRGRGERRLESDDPEMNSSGGNSNGVRK